MPGHPNAEQLERRANIRYPFTAAAEVLEPRSNTTVRGRSADLGPDGCYVDTMTPFPVGTPVKLRLTQENRTFECQAAEIYAHVGMGMGLAFTEIKPDQLTTLQDWLRQLSGELTPPSDSAQAPTARQPLELKERLVLNRLIGGLVRKRILTESEGVEILRELFGASDS